MSSGSLAKATLAALAGFGVGSLTSIALMKAFNWWKSRHSGSIVEANLQGRPTRQTRQLTLYHSFPFRSCRCAWLMNELGVSEYVKVVPIALHGTDAKDLMAYREVHPHGTLPALELEDGTIMLESSAICLYLAEIFLDRDGQSLLPDSQNTSEYYNFICYAVSTLDHILEPLYMQLTHTPEEKRNHTQVESMKRKFTICANVLSHHLGDREYICGDKFTAADCVIGFNVWWASMVQQGTLLEDYPVLRDYLERLKARPNFQKTFVGKKEVKPSGGSL